MHADADRARSGDVGASHSIDLDEVRVWAAKLRDSNPATMTPDEIAADLQAFVQRREFVEGLFEAAKDNPGMKLPGGVTFEQLELAVKGDPRTGQRIPPSP